MIVSITNFSKNWSTNKVKFGFPIQDNLTNELNCAVITAVEMTEKLPISIYDRIRINLNGSYMVYLVANYGYEQVSFTPEKYKLTINLVEPTKLFEGIILPNRAYTNIRQNLTALEAITQALELYTSSLSGFYIGTISLPNPNRILPELVFNKPTLREFIDTILSLDNCRLKIELDAATASAINFSYLNFNEKKGSIPIENVDLISWGNSAENYATSLVSTVENAILPNTITEYVRLQTDEAFFTSKNAKIVLSHPVYDIKKIVIKGVKYSRSNNPDNYYTVDLDITNFVKVKEIYDSLTTLKNGEFETFGVGVNAAEDIITDKLYKNNTFYFERGKNTIDGLMNYETGSTAFSWTDQPAIEYAYRRAGYLNGIKMTLGINNIIEYTIYWQQAKEDYSKFIFEVEYTPYYDSLSITEKNTFDTFFSTTNQGSENTDINLFGAQAINKINQLGNEQISFKGHYIGNGGYNTFDVGMVHSDYTIIKLERTINANLINFTGVMSKNYINENMYTLLDRQKRYYTMSTNEFVVRHELLRKNLWFHMSNQIVFSSPILTTKGKYAVCTVKTSQTESNEYPFIPLLAYKGNQLNYTVEFADSANVGRFRKGYLDDDNQIEIMTDVKYVDDYGEAHEFNLKIYEYALNSDNLALFPESLVFNKPLGFNLLDEYVLESKKDAREKMVLTLQETIKVDNNLYPNVVLADNIINIIDYADNTLYYQYVDQKITYGNINSIEFVEAVGVNFTPISQTINGLRLYHTADQRKDNDNRNFLCYLKKSNGEKIRLFGVNDYHNEYIYIDSEMD